MQHIITTLGNALGLEEVSWPGSGSRTGLKAQVRWSIARAQWADLRRAVRQAVEPGLAEHGRASTTYPGNRPGYATVFYPAKTGEGLAGAYVAIARVGSIGGTWVNPDERKVHIRVLSADPWTGEDTTAEYSGTVADLR